MKALKNLELFARAAQSASLSEAARAMNVSPAVISASLKRLEAELGVALFVRSTRSLRLSPDGAAFLILCQQGLDAFALARDSVATGHGGLRGTVQLSVPSDLGRNLVLEWLQAFRQRHPKVQIRLQVSDRVAGLYREQVDAALRYGDPPISNAISLPVAPHNRRVLCAAPAYLARKGTPKSPRDLGVHNCLSFMLSERAHDRWAFQRGSEVVEARVQGSFQCDDGDAVRRLALLGEGIVYKSRLDVARDLQQGRLIGLCPDWMGEPAPLHLVCPDRRVLKPALRLLRDFLVEQIARVDL